MSTQNHQETKFDLQLRIHLLPPSRSRRRISFKSDRTISQAPQLPSAATMLPRTSVFGCYMLLDSTLETMSIEFHQIFR